jgi:hypothetical protein
MGGGALMPFSLGLVSQAVPDPRTGAPGRAQGQLADAEPGHVPVPPLGRGRRGRHCRGHVRSQPVAVRAQPVLRRRAAPVRARHRLAGCHREPDDDRGRPVRQVPGAGAAPGHADGRGAGGHRGRAALVHQPWPAMASPNLTGRPCSAKVHRAGLSRAAARHYGGGHGAAVQSALADALGRALHAAAVAGAGPRCSPCWPCCSSSTALGCTTDGPRRAAGRPRPPAAPGGGRRNPAGGGWATAWPPRPWPRRRAGPRGCR